MPKISAKALAASIERLIKTKNLKAATEMQL